jgi:hypothetical protein
MSDEFERTPTFDEVRVLHRLMEGLAADGVLVVMFKGGRAECLRARRQGDEHEPLDLLVEKASEAALVAVAVESLCAN